MFSGSVDDRSQVLPIVHSSLLLNPPATASEDAGQIPDAPSRLELETVRDLVEHTQSRGLPASIALHLARG